MPEIGLSKALDRGFSIEIEGSEDRWVATTAGFADSNIYQTWGYGVARAQVSKLCHLVLKRDGQAVAAVQVRFAGLPQLRLGLAYIRWGPMWNKAGQAADPTILRQMVRAIRNEFTLRRGLVVRLFPQVRADENISWESLLMEEGFERTTQAHSYRTLLMDLRPTLEELEKGLHQKWRKHLNRARKGNLQIIEGESDDLFAAVVQIYQEMAARKGLSGTGGIEHYRKAQPELASGEKLTVILCKEGEEVVSGAVFSKMGDSGLDLFRATSNQGVQNYASYLVQWKVLESLKRRNCQWYNLHGINPVKNPGGYQFKSQLAGKHGLDLHFPGPFDCHPNRAIRLLARTGEGLKARLEERRQKGQAPAPNAAVTESKDDSSQKELCEASK